MKDSELQDSYRELLRDRPAERGGCPAPEAIVALIERRGAEGERMATLGHVTRCGACKADFDLMRTVAEGRPVPGRRVSVPLAAAASIALFLSGAVLFAALRARNNEANVARGGSDGVELVSPRGDSHVRPVTFVWRKAAGPARYSLEVFTPAGDAVYTVDVADTAVVLPPSVALEIGKTYHWWVLVRSSNGAEVRTPPVAFTP